MFLSLVLIQWPTVVFILHPTAGTAYNNDSGMPLCVLTFSGTTAEVLEKRC